MDVSLLVFDTKRSSPARELLFFTRSAAPILLPEFLGKVGERLRALVHRLLEACQEVERYDDWKSDSRDRSKNRLLHTPHPLRELLDIDRADAGALQRDRVRAVDDKRLLRNDIVGPRCDRCEREIVLRVTQRDRLGLIVVELKLHLKCLFHDSFSFPLVMRQLRASKSQSA